ncbi:MAG: hypothetical protein RMK18_03765 [Armatimonadota bacterium]|nr:hypothetical protein [Armatimonadota bacterium]MCX7778036.1 hypothetical protein [Armatimonadota bacterium]MDW8024966.1 hypothetical protein [Armatimonadota bacterium]
MPFVKLTSFIAAISSCCTMLNDALGVQPNRAIRRHAIIFVLDYVSLSDLLSARPPKIMRLLSSGGIAALCTRTGGAFNPANACVTIACGDRVAVSSDGEVALNIFEPFETGYALSAYERYTGRSIRSSKVSIVLPYVEGLKRSLVKSFHRVTPFALGDLIKASGMRAAVIGCDDTSLEHAPDSLFRHAALIASSSDGVIPLGDVSKRMLMRNAKAPFGVSINMEAFDEELKRCFASADLITIDIGETYRAALHAARSSDKIAIAARAAALLKCDEAIGLILGRFNEHKDLLIIFTTASSGALKNELGFIIAYGFGVTKKSLLTSETTRRLGLVSLTDIAPTVLHHLGIRAGVRMVGRRMVSIRADEHVERVRKLIELTSQSDGMLRSVALYFMSILQSLHAMLILIWAAHIRYSRNSTALTLGKVSNGIGAFIMALPISYWCEVILRERIAAPFVTLQFVWLIALLLSAILWTASSGEVRYIVLLSVISFAVMLADAFTGARLQLASIMGYSPYYGGRFYGLGNVGMAAALGCSLLVSCVVSGILTHNLLRLPVWFAIGLLTAVAIGHPNVGANFGGLLSAIPSFGVGYIAMQRIKISWRCVLFVALVLACALVIFVIVDLLRGVEGMSHLGRFVILIREHGFGAFTSMLVTKAVIWWRAFKHAPFTVALCVYALFGAVGVFLIRREVANAVVGDDMLRALVASFACGALLSFLINDSGPITPVVMLSYGWSAIWLIIVRAVGNASLQSRF